MMGWFVDGWREGAGWLNRRIERKTDLRQGRPSYLGTRLAGLVFEATAAAVFIPPLFLMASRGFVGVLIWLPLILVGPLMFVGLVRTRVKARRGRVALEEFASACAPGVKDLDGVGAARAAIAGSFGIEPELLRPQDDAASLRWFLERPTALEICTRFADSTGRPVRAETAARLSGERREVAAAVRGLLDG
jgi:hypothetical protein